MRRLRMLLLTLIFTVSTVIYAEKSARIYDLKGLSAEVELLLREYGEKLPEGKVITIFFSVSEDNTIQYVTVAAPDGKTGNLLEKKLKDHQLDGNKWREGMIYELSIEGRSSLECLSK